MQRTSTSLDLWLRRLTPCLAAIALATTPAFAGDDDDDDDDNGGSGNGNSRFPRVSVHAIDSQGVETNRADTLVFEFRRTGETNTPLNVYFKTEGRAVFGVDFEPADPASTVAIPRDDRGRPNHPRARRLVIPAGATSARLVLAPIPDEKPERNERFEIHVMPSSIWKIDGRPDQSYRPGDPDEAEGTIVEVAPPPPTEAPVVTVAATRAETTEPTPITRVRPGVFTVSRTGPTTHPLRIEYSLEGTASNRTDYKHLDGDTSFGVGQATKEIKVEALADSVREPDETVVLRLRTLPAYQVGAAASATVVIHDASPVLPASLVFTAPAPGAEFTEPAAVTLVLKAIDPAGYIPRVEFFSGDTSIGTSTVTFIQAPEPGTPVEHTLAWNAVAAGDYRIVARATDSLGNAVASQPLALVVRKPVTPPPVVRHPADINPADDVLTGEEVAAYADAWRAGTNPPVGPAPAPIDFLTRAGYLWQAGGGYKTGATPGTFPLAWITTNPDPGPGAGADGSVNFALAEVPPTGTDGSYTLAVRSGPATGIRSHAIEIRLAPGSTVASVSDDGTYDPATATLRWGPFHDDVDRRLVATVTTPAITEVSGVVSFDGSNIAVAKVPPPPPTPGGEDPGPTLASVAPTADGSVRLVVIDDHGNDGTEVEVEVEVSHDLNSWMGISRHRRHRGATSVVDTDANEDTVRFYRAVRRRP